MRNFGIMSGRQRLGGTSASPSAYGANSTRADLNSFPLPAGSISRRKFDQVQEAQSRSNDFEIRSRVFVTVFLSLVFAIPMILAGIMLHFR